MTDAALDVSNADATHLARLRSARLAERILRWRELGIVLALVVVFALTSADNSNFASVTSLQQLLSGAAIIAVLAIGETIVIITRNVDLSVGSVLGLSAYLVGYLFQHHPSVPIPLVFLAALGVGLACGIVNGALVTIARVPSLVVTLGTLYVIRGIDAVWAGGNQVGAYSLPNGFNNIGYGSIVGVPYLGIIAVVAVAVGTYAMRAFRPARDFYAIGSSPEAARLSGIRVERRVFSAFALSGAIAGLAGALWLSYYGSVDSTAGTGYELQVIAAVVVGGVAIFGGSGTILGAALGALLLNMISNALVVVRISSSWDMALDGALLLGAITFDRIISKNVVPALRTRRSRVVA